MIRAARELHAGTGIDLRIGRAGDAKPTQAIGQVRRGLVRAMINPSMNASTTAKIPRNTRATTSSGIELGRPRMTPWR
jgi:hypothetical protein